MKIFTSKVILLTASIATIMFAPSAFAAQSINLNQSVSASISRQGEVDTYIFRVPSSQVVELYTTGSTDTLGHLYNYNTGSRIEIDDDDGDGYNFKIRRTLSAGTYRITVRGYNSSTTGSYRLYVKGSSQSSSDDHGNSRGSATSVSLGNSSSGNIERGGDVDYFRIYVPSSKTVTFRTSGGTDTYGTLYNSSGRVLARNDDSDGRNFKITKSLSRGTYYLAVRHYSQSGTGRYDFRTSATSSSSTSINSIVDSFVRRQDGNFVDMDGSLPGSNTYNQCVDLVHAYIQYGLGVPRSSHNIRGNAYALYNSLGTYTTISHGSRRVRLTKIPNSRADLVPQKGDIIFWDTSAGRGYGHVGIFLSGDMYNFNSFDQNWPVGSAPSSVHHNYTSPRVVGWLRPEIISE